MTDSDGNERVSFIYLVRWVPDPVRDEAENVGIVVYDEAGDESRSRWKDGTDRSVARFSTTTDKDECDWMVDNAFNCLQVRRMVSVAPGTLDEILEEAWQRFVA